jgi:tetratricopeptide (TPR) repeat protein
MTTRNDDNSNAAAGGQAAAPTTDPTAIQSTTPPPMATGIQTAPLEPGRVPLSPLTAGDDAVLVKRRERTLQGLTVLLVVLALGLAGLSAAIPIRNSDLFMHLGTAKLMVEGKYTFGADPFTVNSHAARWVNHSWLFDLASYGLFRLTGGEGLVVAKTMVVVALAAVLLLIRRRGESLWIPAMCTALAIVTLSPRLLYQPQVLSFLFLALTIAILAIRGRRKVPPGEETLLDRFAAWPYRLWLLPILFAIWANVDAWFVLGPITVLLFWLGETVQEMFAPLPSGQDAPLAEERRKLPLVLLVSTAACLLNPFHIYAFTFPNEVSPAVSQRIKTDDALKEIFLSPWSSDAIMSKDLGHNFARMAYYLLLALSLGSFVLNRAGWRCWRVMVWTAFAVLAAFYIRCVPFFAVVAGPIMTLNFQDYWAARVSERREPTPGLGLWPIAGRALSIVLLAVVALAAWPGWLHGWPGDPQADRHRVGWGLDMDKGLEETARDFARWREEGKISGEQNAFNFQPDVATYLSFYCPEEKTFFDYRFPLFSDTADAYYKLRQELNPKQEIEESIGGRTAPRLGAGDWRAVFRERHIKYVIVNELEFGRALAFLRHAADDARRPDAEREWTLIALHGHVAVYAWSDPLLGPDPVVQSMQLDPYHLAFGPTAKPAPPQGPDRAPRTRGEDYVEDFRQAQMAVPVDSAEAQFHFFMSEFESTHIRHETVEAYGQQVLSGILFGTTVRSIPQYAFFQLVTGRRALGIPAGKFNAPASLYLALRASRRALAADPDDYRALRWLGINYTKLRELEVAEELMSNSGSLLGEIRRCQIAGCLVQTLKAKPDDVEARHLLARYYLRQNWFDLALQHMKEESKLTHEAGPYPSERDDQFRERLHRLDDAVKVLDDQVKNAKNDFLIATKDWTRVRDKVAFARKRGLMGEAIDLLEHSSVPELGRDGQVLELWLLLQVGRVRDVRNEWTPLLTDSPELDRVGPFVLPIYKWLMVLQAATLGDYQEADALLKELIDVARARTKRDLPLLVCPGVGFLFRTDFFDPSGQRPLAWTIVQREEFLKRLQAFRYVPLDPVEEGELNVLRGMLAVEAGNNRHAEECFRNALTLTTPPARYLPLLSIMGAPGPFGAASAAAIAVDLATGPTLPLPSQYWAVEYLNTLNQADK